MKGLSHHEKTRRAVRYLVRSSSDAIEHRHISIALRLVLGLLGLVILGTILLSLPGVAVGERLSLGEALFTATSAVTVTGLTVITASTDLTRWGQFLLLMLIQVGGVGYVFVFVLALQLVGRRVSLVDRLTLSSSLGLSKPEAILQILRRTLAGVLILEGVGAALLYIHWTATELVPEDDVLFYAIFHAISAFCNAGFDLFAGLAEHPRGIPGDTPSLLIMGVLIFLGGLGIPVLSDLLVRRQNRRLSLHSRLTLIVVAVLVVIGWIGLLIPETRPGGVLADAPLDEQLVHTWFQSISTRTAGFPGLEDFDNLVPESQLLVMALMFIGSAPASMGGGITTGTFVVLVLALWSYVHGKAHVQVSRRSIPSGTVRRAAMILITSLIVVVFASWLILLTHDLSLNTVLFEVISAFATCGLSLGITDALNPIGRFVIMVTMFWGRLGAMTLVVAITQWTAQTEETVRYPEEPVLI